MTKEKTVVVLIDNDTLSRMCHSAFLKGCGFNVLETDRATSGLALIREKNPDVIVSSIILPQVSGLELLRICTKEFCSIPFILLGEKDAVEQVGIGLGQGAWDCVMKPVEPQELLEHCIIKAVEQSSLIKRFEEHELRQRRDQEKKALDAVTQWRNAVDAFPEMIVIVDSKKKVHRFNKSMLSFVGATAAEFKGSDYKFCNQEHQDTHETVIKDQKAQKIKSYFAEKKRYIKINIVPYFLPDEEVVGAIHVFHDISLEKNAEKEKEILYAKLLQTQKLEAVGQLAAGIAHEINTPTQFISSNLRFLEESFTDLSRFMSKIEKHCAKNELSPEVLQDKLDELDWDFLQEEIPSALGQSVDGLSRVSSIVKAMKEFSHPGAKDFELVDINNLINVTSVVARNEWKYVADLTLNLDTSIPEILCLSGELGQVVLNLIINAIHSIAEKIKSRPDRDKGSLVVTTKVKNKYLVITISDDGDGIPKAIQQKVFEPFFTTKAIGKGTGQGLAIAYDVVVNKHGGKLTFDSEQRVGTTFTIQLPLRLDT